MVRNRRESGFVYFIQCGDDRGPIKIGRGRDVEDRLTSHQIGNPYPLRLLTHVYVDDPRKAEWSLHQRFTLSRIRGEWFAWSPDLADVVRRVDEYEKAVTLSKVTVLPPPSPPHEFVYDYERPRIEPQHTAHGQALIDEAKRMRREEWERTPPPDPPPPPTKPTLPAGFFEWRGKLRRHDGKPVSPTRYPPPNG